MNSSKRYKITDKRIYCFIALALSVFLSLGQPHFSQSNKTDDQRKSETVAPGIEHIEIRRGDQSQVEGPDRWFINVLVIDPISKRVFALTDSCVDKLDCP